MIPLRLEAPAHLPVRILALGAHSDDIEIGCGGTVLRLLSTRRNLEFYWMVFSSGSGSGREREARKSSSLFLKGARRTTVVVKDFRNGYFPYIGAEIKDCFEELKREISPQVIFTHCRDDRHQDHRLLWELTWNTFRDHMILEYEIPKYDGDLGAPNVFMPLTAAQADKKVRYLLKIFSTQRKKHWFTRETFLALMRLRGMESCSPSGYAEAFYSRKLVLA